jgi:hypothetical protein
MKGAAAQPRAARDIKDNDPSPRAAAPGAGVKKASPTSADEAQARAALEGLKRIRAQARMDKIAIAKPAPVVVPPAMIVAKPPPPRPTWVIPLASVAVAVGLVVSGCTGVIAYLTMQPGQTSAATSAEIRGLRETVAQLRRQVSGVSENLDGLRTAVDLSSKTTNDRFGRFAENLDRIERVNTASTARLEKLALAQTPAPAPVASQPPWPAQPPAMLASAASSTEVTGSVSSPAHASTPRKVVKGWSVRQAYEGVAILQGPSGVIEAILGQQVPGLGRIEEIKVENGHLLVLTSAGAVVPALPAVPARKPQP